MRIKRSVVVALVVTALAVPVGAKAYSIPGGLGGLGRGGSAVTVTQWILGLIVWGAVFTSPGFTDSAPPMFPFAAAPDPSNHPAIRAMKLDEAESDLLNAYAYAKSPVKALRDPRIFSPHPWSGFYVGADVGGLSGSSKWTDTVGDLAGVPGDYLRVGQVGGLFGLHAGYEMQSGRWLYGIEGAIAWSGSKGDFTLALPPAIGTFTSETEWLGSVMGRVGMLFHGPFAGRSSVGYVKAGVAFAEFRNSFVLNGAVGPFVFPAVNNTSVGFAIGTGVEMSVGDNWAVRYDTTYYNFGKENYTFGHPVFGPARMDINHWLLVSKIGLTKRFN